jgi:hypothetical protein
MHMRVHEHDMRLCQNKFESTTRRSALRIRFHERKLFGDLQEDIDHTATRHMHQSLELASRMTVLDTLL